MTLAAGRREDQIQDANTPMRALAEKHRDDLVIFVGKQGARGLAESYGFNNAITAVRGSPPLLTTAHPPFARRAHAAPRRRSTTTSSRSCTRTSSPPTPIRSSTRACPNPTPPPPLPRGPRPPSPTAFRLFGSPDAVGSYQDLWYISGPSEEEANKLRQPVAAILIVADPIPCTLAPRYRCGRLPSQPTGICFAQGDATCRSASIFSARTATRMSARTRKGWPATSPAATWNMPPSGTILGWAMAPSPSRSRRSTSSSTESLCRRRCSVGTHRRSAQRKQHRQPLPCSLGIERANRRR